MKNLKKKIFLHKLYFEKLRNFYLIKYLGTSTNILIIVDKLSSEFIPKIVINIENASSKKFDAAII
tara:strand:- start:160 stop:357 length:198 start_codon:yes stop_codon:yes gene_type:complete